MADPWLSIIGINEDGLSGLTGASRDALLAAEIVFGGPRHLALAQVGARGREWPVPFSVAPVLECRGRKVAVLASGDPFWHGAGGSLMPHLAAGEWVSHPAPSTFSLAANLLGWRLEDTACLGLHAAPLERLVPVLTPGSRAICLMRDAAAVAELAAWLVDRGFGSATLWVMEALGGPDARLRKTPAKAYALNDLRTPVAVAIATQDAPHTERPTTPGLPDDTFAHDGQITKSAVRALTLSALAPRRGERLWDLGAGSGSVSVEWCLAGGVASAVERNTDRAANIRANAARFGVADRLHLTEGTALASLATLPAPDAVFVGGGLDAALLQAVWAAMPKGARLLINAVTLETEALLLTAQAEKGGDLMRIDLARAAPLGRMRGWVPARPVVQWSVVR